MPSEAIWSAPPAGLAAAHQSLSESWMVRFCRLEAWLPVGVAWTYSGSGSEDEPALAVDVPAVLAAVLAADVKKARQVRPGRGGEPPRVRALAGVKVAYLDPIGPRR